MEKILIFSDLHGDAKVMSELEKVYKDNNCDFMIFLGDLLYHGPRNDLPIGYNPKEVVKILKPYSDKLLWIKGNCDAEVDEMVMGFPASKRQDLTIFNKDFTFVHGHHIDFSIVTNEFKENSFVLYGHYHIYQRQIINNISFINIGSPSLPKDGVRQYALLDKDNLTIYDLDDNSILDRINLNNND